MPTTFTNNKQWTMSRKHPYIIFWSSIVLLHSLGLNLFIWIEFKRSPYFTIFIHYFSILPLKCVAEDANTTICAKKHENCTHKARSKLNILTVELITTVSILKYRSFNITIRYNYYILSSSSSTPINTCYCSNTWHVVKIMPSSCEHTY